MGFVNIDGELIHTSQLSSLQEDGRTICANCTHLQKLVRGSHPWAKYRCVAAGGLWSHKPKSDRATLKPCEKYEPQKQSQP
jgi:hypothetical protein